MNMFTEYSRALQRRGQWTVIEERRPFKKKLSDAKSKRLKESLKDQRLVRIDKRKPPR